MYITGEVANPGPYALRNKDEKLIELIARAGGLTKDADTRGMLFLRQKESLENSQQGKDADLILQKTKLFSDKEFVMHLAQLGVALPPTLIENARMTSESLAKPAEVANDENLKTNSTAANEATFNNVKVNNVASASETSKQVKLTQNMAKPTSEESEYNPSDETGQTLKKEKTSAMGPRVSPPEGRYLPGFEGRHDLASLLSSSRISINLDEAFRDPKSPDNIPMVNGDRIFIPKVTNVVTVLGAVLHPHSFAAGPGESVGYYLQRSGGFAEDAAKSEVVVVRLNGDALPMSKVRAVEPGDMILVPTTGFIDVTKKIDKIGSVTKVITDALSSIFVLTKL